MQTITRRFPKLYRTIATGTKLDLTHQIYTYKDGPHPEATDKIVFLADGDARLTEAMGLDMDLKGFGGIRAKRGAFCGGEWRGGHESR